MNENLLSLEELELLAAGYVLDDLDLEEKNLVEKLIQSSEAMRTQIREAIELTEILATSVDSISPPLSLKNKISQVFSTETDPQQETINLADWFQAKFAAGWQTAAQLLETPNYAPAFRNYEIAGGKIIKIGAAENEVILTIKIKQTSPDGRDIEVEILPKLKQESLPSELKIMILDGNKNVVMEATTYQDNKKIEFEFAGISGEVFSIKFEQFQDSYQEDFIL